MAMMINPPHKNIPHVLDKAKNLTIIRLSFYLVITMTLMTTPQSTHDYLIEILTPLAESSDIAQALLHIITHNQLSDELLQSLKTIVNESVHNAIKESEKDLLVGLKSKLDAIKLAETQEKNQEGDPDLTLRQSRP